MRFRPAMHFFVLTLALLAPAAVVAQLIEGDDISLTDPTPEIVFTDTDNTAVANWTIRGYDEFFQIFDPASGFAYLNISPTLSSVGLGFLTSSNGISSIALGRQADSSGQFSTALGRGATSTAQSSTAIGDAAIAAGASSTAIGFVSNASGIESTALGAYAYASQDYSVVLGAIAGFDENEVYANVGIGTPAPAEAVDVERSAAAARFQLTSFTSDATQAPQYIQRRARGTTVAPTAVQNNDNLGLFSFRGHNGTAMGGSRATITAQAAGNFTGASTPTRLIFATTPVGSTTPQQVLVITPDGKVQVKGVNLNVPDYVFEDDYELMPLDELKTFIDQNGHLPGIPSADEVNTEGHDLAGSDMAHLRKIEELTLYTLQQDTELNNLRSEVTNLRAQSERLEAMVSKLLQERDKS